MAYEVETRNVHGRVTAVGSAGTHTLVIDRPKSAGGEGLGFNGGELLHLAVAACISNDLFREATLAGISLESVRVTAHGDFAGEPAVSTGVSYDVAVTGDADDERLQALVHHVDRVAEIPLTLRRGARVSLGRTTVRRASRPAAKT